MEEGADGEAFGDDGADFGGLGGGGGGEEFVEAGGDVLGCFGYGEEVVGGLMKVHGWSFAAIGRAGFLLSVLFLRWGGMIRLPFLFLSLLLS